MENDPIRKLIPLRRRIVFLSIPYLLLALLIVGIEGAARIFLPYIPPLDALIDSDSLRFDLGGKKDSPLFMADPLLFWRVRPNLKEIYWDFTVLSTNAQGFRVDHDIGRKPAGGFRIVCVGDSVTFGYRVPMAFPDRPHDFDHNFFPYPELCQKRLRATNPNRPVEIIPLAAPAYTTYQGLNLFRRNVDFLKPDVVTACFGWNDVCLRSLPDRESMPVDWPHLTARTLMCHSQAVIHFSRWRQHKQTKKSPAPGGSPVPRVSRDDYVANLLEISKLARAHGAQCVLIAQVYQDAQHNPQEANRVRTYRDALRAAAAANDVPYLEIDQLLESNYPENKKLFGEPIHPNAQGHQVMASELLKFLAAKGMLDSLHVPDDL